MIFLVRCFIAVLFLSSGSTMYLILGETAWSQDVTSERSPAPATEGRSGYQGVAVYRTEAGWDWPDSAEQQESQEDPSSTTTPNSNNSPTINNPVGSQPSEIPSNSTPVAEGIGLEAVGMQEEILKQTQTKQEEVEDNVKKLLEQVGVSEQRPRPPPPETDESMAIQQ
jgi:hypothetical protein